RAIELSIENVRTGAGGPFGAIITRGSEIIAEGTNRVTATNDPTAHAEMVAIRAACQKLRTHELKDCEIYASCEACPMCLGAMYWAHLARIYFGGLAGDASKGGSDDSLIYNEISLPHGQRRVPMAPMMRERSLEAFRLWSATADKISY